MKDKRYPLYERIFRFAYRFATVRILFPLKYQLLRLVRPVKPQKTIFFELRGSSVSDNFALLLKYADEHTKLQTKVYYMHYGEHSHWSYLKKCLQMVGEIVDAKYIFISDAYNVLCSLPIRSETKLIQTWHGCGAFKKFGMSTADLLFGNSRSEKKIFPPYRHTAIVTVSSPEIIDIYAEAMDLPREVVRPLGVSRTDIFFDQNNEEAAKDRVQQAFAPSRNKRVILYAPTFRGHVDEPSAPDVLDIAQMKEKLGAEYVLLIKHHPFIKELPKIPEELSDFAFDASGILSIEDLMFTADICISDYSSLIFEYSLLNRPMLFLAYDRADYLDWRGFYYDYESFVPGAIVENTEQVIDHILNPRPTSGERLEEFRQKFMQSCDGKSTERIMNEILKL